jgi:hypothetical protein
MLRVENNVSCCGECIVRFEDAPQSEERNEKSVIASLRASPEAKIHPNPNKQTH